MRTTLLAKLVPLAITLWMSGLGYSVQAAAPHGPHATPPAKTPLAKTPPAKSSPAKPAPGKPAARAFSDQEAAVVEFLREHHPELAELLVPLRLNRPKDYQRAIRDLAKACERLSNIQEEDDEQYEAELQSWVVKSRIHLVVARLSMNDSGELRDELRKLLQEQMDVRLQLLRIERDRQAARLAKLDEQIRELANTRHAHVEKQLQSLTKSSQKVGTRIKQATAKNDSGATNGTQR